MIDQPSASTGLDHWIRRLTSRDMPIFSYTAKRIAVISSMTQSPAAELANAILQDALLTTRVLKMANSAFYMGGRPGRGGNRNPVSTVTRAVMILGFDTIRAICQTKAVVEDLLKGVQRERLTQKMACSFHAAAQARWLAVQSKEESPEEIFIAAFLYLLGEMVFWCFADEPFIEKMEKELAVSQADPRRTVQQILGFDFDQLTLALNKEWLLNPLLLEALETGPGSNSRVKAILWGHRLAQAVQKGWQTTEVARLIDQVADALSLPRGTVLEMVHENAREAIQTAVSYGAHKAGRLIPLPDSPDAAPGTLEALEDSTLNKAKAGFTPSLCLQMKILQDLSNLMLEKKPDYGLFISLVLEGILRAVGMDRVWFALYSRDRSRLDVKFQLGWQGMGDSSSSGFAPLPANHFLLEGILDKKQPQWLDPPGGSVGGIRGGQALLPWIEGYPFFIMPIVAQGKTIGLVYADRQTSGRELDEESFQGFQHFCRQATIGLSLITQQ